MVSHVCAFYLYRSRAQWLTYAERNIASALAASYGMELR
jgi:hypothetical protein